MSLNPNPGANIKERVSYNWLRYKITDITETTVKTDIFNILKQEDSCPYMDLGR